MATKPVPYPNLVNAIDNLADVHANVHAAVKTHAQTHARTLADRRQALELKNSAKKLTEGGE